MEQLLKKMVVISYDKYYAEYDKYYDKYKYYALQNSTNVYNTSICNNFVYSYTLSETFETFLCHPHSEQKWQKSVILHQISTLLWIMCAFTRERMSTSNTREEIMTTIHLTEQWEKTFGCPAHAKTAQQKAKHLHTNPPVRTHSKSERAKGHLERSHGLGQSVGINSEIWRLEHHRFHLQSES